jgi:hypothetical protein
MTPIDGVVAGILALFAGDAFREREWAHCLALVLAAAYIIAKSYV